MAATTIMNWLKTDVAQRSPVGFGAASPASTEKPPLNVLYAFYLQSFAPIRASSVQPLPDFVEVLRQYDKTKIYSDQEWVPFFMQFTAGDEDAARDMWDGLVCQ